MSNRVRQFFVLSGLGLFMSFLCQSAAFASSDRDTAGVQSDRGFYLQGGLGTFVFAAISSISSDDVAAGAGALTAFGYQFSPTFALEMDAIYGHYSYNDKNYTPERHYSLDGMAIGPAIKHIIPLGDSWRLYGKVGFALFMEDGSYTEEGSSSVDQPDGGGVIGLPFNAVGVSYAVNQHVDIGFEYTGFIFLALNAGLASASLTYHF